jgi:beta-lactamase class A
MQTDECGPRPSGITTSGSLQGLVESEILYLRGCRQLRDGDQVSLQVYDLANKKMLADINGDTPRNAASLIKPFVMLAVYDAVARQELQENHELERLLQRMITVSDNPATNQLIRRLGNGDTTQGLVAVNALMAKMGFGQTRVKELIPDGGKTYRNQTSAGDATLFFRLLYEQKLVSPHYSQKMNDILLRNVHDRIETFKIKQDGVAVADKTGYVRGLNADCGIVYQKTQNPGQDYVLSIFIENKAKPADGWGKRKSAVIRYLSDRIYENLKNGQASKVEKRRTPPQNAHQGFSVSVIQS